jgi:hypothetical protein
LEHELEDVGVGTRWNALEEVVRENLESRSLQRGNDLGPVEQQHMGLGKHRGDRPRKPTRPTPDVDNPLKAMESHCLDQLAVSRARTAEDLLKLGGEGSVLTQGVEEALAVGDLEGSFSRSNAIQQLTPRVPV